MNSTGIKAKGAMLSQIGKSSLLILVFGLVGLPALGETFRCSFGNIPNTYYVPAAVDLTFGEFGKVKVVDKIIAATGAKSVFGAVETDNAKRMTIQWKVRHVKRDPKELARVSGDMIVRMTIQKSDRSAVLNVSDAQGRNPRSYRATGQCDLAD